MPCDTAFARKEGVLPLRKIAMTITFALLTGVLGDLGAASAQSKADIPPSNTKITLKSLAAQVANLTQTVNTLQGQLTAANTMITNLQNQLNSTNAQNAFALGQFVTVDKTDTLNGLVGPHIIFTGANLHIRSGSGKTLDGTNLGNLIVGYDSDNSTPTPS